MLSLSLEETKERLTLNLSLLAHRVNYNPPWSMFGINVAIIQTVRVSSIYILT